VIFDLPTAVGMGNEAFPSFWIGGSESRDPLHIAFSASNRAAVDAFYRAALAAGGRDNGQPGVRAQYHPNYYAAFVYDPDGNNIEISAELERLPKGEPGKRWPAGGKALNLWGPVWVRDAPV